MEKNINIELFIKKLLYNNDCVIVPGFGGFVTVYKPATILPKQNVMLPPTREIGFNKKLINNDGLLANEIAVQKEISFDQALQIIQARVNFYQEELQRVKRLEIINVGVLYIDKDNNYRFMPDESKNFLKKSFGLNKIYLDKIEPQVKQNTQVIPLQPVASLKEKKSFAWNKVAAAVAIPLFLLGGYWLGSKLDKDSASLASLNLFNQNEKQKIVADYEANNQPITWDEADANPDVNLESVLQQTTEKSLRYSFMEENVSESGVAIFTETDQIASSEVTKESIPTTPESITPIAEESATQPAAEVSNQYNYYIVAGAFQDRTNADKLVNKLKRKGFNAHVFDKQKGLNYVCFDGYASKADAKADLARVRSTTASAWIKAN